MWFQILEARVGTLLRTPKKLPLPLFAYPACSSDNEDRDLIWFVRVRTKFKIPQISQAAGLGLAPGGEVAGSCDGGPHDQSWNTRQLQTNRRTGALSHGNLPRELGAVFFQLFHGPRFGF